MFLFSLSQLMATHVDLLRSELSITKICLEIGGSSDA